ncbi:MAG: hypothetical protein Q9226_003081 [Calogaya cf. arnoldii]
MENDNEYMSVFGDDTDSDDSDIHDPDYDDDASEYENSEGPSEDSASEAEDPKSFLTEKDFKQFIDEIQVGPKEAELRFLVSLPANKVYNDDDLDDEDVLNLALRLLYAERVGEGNIRDKPSIHLNYGYLNSEVGKTVQEEMESLQRDVSVFIDSMATRNEKGKGKEGERKATGKRQARAKGRAKGQVKTGSKSKGIMEGTEGAGEESNTGEKSNAGEKSSADEESSAGLEESTVQQKGKRKTGQAKGRAQKVQKVSTSTSDNLA